MYQLSKTPMNFSSGVANFWLNFYYRWIFDFVVRFVRLDYMQIKYFISVCFPQKLLLVSGWSCFIAYKATSSAEHFCQLFFMVTVNTCHSCLPHLILYFAVHWTVVVSAKEFYKSQPVIDFACETLGVRDLEDGKIQIDKEKLKKAIYGNSYFCIHNFTLIC